MKKRIPLYLFLFLLLTASAGNDARQGNEAYEKGNYEEAEKLYASALEEEPDNAKLYFNLGNAQAKQGKVEEAIQSYMEFRGLSKTAKEKAMAEYNIGTLMAQEKKWKPATVHFKNSLKLNPADEDAKHNYELAVANMAEGDNEQQQQQQNQPPPEPSEYAKAMKKQAEKLVKQRKYKEAYELMQRARQADETVDAFKDFIERIKNVSDINSN
ncbi:MAG: tetratricopeptide repeat protein [Balneolaceae bacterium]|nr:tetratricopeptide repeat protein [Balneolaceae bacterium]